MKPAALCSTSALSVTVIRQKCDIGGSGTSQAFSTSLSVVICLKLKYADCTSEHFNVSGLNIHLPQVKEGPH